LKEVSGPIEYLYEHNLNNWRICQSGRHSHDLLVLNEKQKIVGIAEVDELLQPAYRTN